MHHPRRAIRWGSLFAVVAVVWAVPLNISKGATGEQIARFTAWDAQAGDGFGSSIAVGQQVALVGAPTIGTTPSHGSVYVYDLNTGGIEFTLTASDSTVADGFGSSIAVDNATAIIGATFGGSDTSAIAGAAYLFDLQTGNELAKLTAIDSESLDGFGTSVAISGTTVLIGAGSDNHDAGVDAGSAYLFDISTGTEIAKLTASDAVPNARFGSSVALAGNTAVIGASHDPQLGNESGAAYVFDTVTGLQSHKLFPENPVPGAHFGRSVATAGGLAVIGAPTGGDHSGPGAAYVFDLSSGEQLYKLSASDATVSDHFGMSVALGLNIVVIGATHGAADESSLAGAAYVFDLTTGEQIAKLNASDTQAIDYFGGAVTVMNNTAAIGARGNNTADGVDAGAAYLFDLSQPLKGDIDGDGFVGINDLNLVFANWNQGIPPANPLADLTGDGFVGIDDLTLILSNWNTGTPPASQAPLPEPASATFLLVAFLAAFTGRTRPSSD